jgi:hypothetical protein
VNRRDGEREEGMIKAERERGREVEELVKIQEGCSRPIITIHQDNK